MPAAKVSINRLTSIVLLLFIAPAKVAIASSFYSNPSEMCKLIKKEGSSVAYLLDEHGHFSKGPIAFGRYRYIVKKNRGDLFYIPTKYSMVITPARLHPRHCTTGGCLELKKVASICTNSATYSISIAMQEYRDDPAINDWLPYKVNDDVDITPIQDPKSYTGWAELDFRFDMRVVGVIIDDRRNLHINKTD